MTLAACFWQRPSRLLKPSSLTRRVASSHLAYTRRLSVHASSSRTVERDSTAGSLRANDSETRPRMQDAIADHALPLLYALPPRRPANRTITTLDPARLHSGCFVDVSGVAQADIYAPFPGHDPYPESYPLIYYERNRKRGTAEAHYDRVAFPPGTHGFLYFHATPHNPLHAQIRFRVTRDSDPAGFARGHDLLYDKGYVWHLPVAVVAARAPTDALLRMLLRDGLLDARLIAELRSSAVPHVRLKRAIVSLREPFVIDLTMYLHRIMAAGDRYPIMLALPHFGYRNREHDLVSLYEEGSALCRFERSMLPEHEGKRAIVMRLLKMLVPPKRIPGRPSKYDLPLPAEGELFAKRGRVWYKDVDKNSKIRRVLRMLYDVDENPEPS